jgi:LysR family hydrogen peroxide-inducible transcriptional activator
MIVAALNEGTLDAGLLALEADIGKVERAAIAEDPFVLATARDHPLGATKSEVSAEELRGTAIMLLDDGHCFRDQALAFCSDLRAHEGEFRATSLSTLTQMVACGVGVTLLPRLSVATESKRAALRVRGFEAPSPHRTIGLVWRKGSPLAEALKKIADAIRQAYPSG